ncbi:CotH kinase family protein [Ruminococcus sp. 5_1_39BFAA]|uniref:CotH kinase family protein n=1 Tax=Ruminococcus sp. 5_1_39BFAA TaxID=457412 RepID=UPI003564423B
MNMEIRVLTIFCMTFFLLACTGCKSPGESAAAEVSEEIEVKREGDYAAKETLEEAPLTDNKALYAEDDETSVVTMYLTVSSGNEGDNTNHTWTEINSHSNYDYEEMGVPRYNVDAILQVGDENGPVEGEFGYGETVPNAAVQVRGQTSSRSQQKNYKIRIKEGKGSWREQRTIALNKHVGEPSRFRNKLAYDLMKEIPQMMSARTQFVHLYVKDETEGGSGEFEDYGLYTQVEQMNKTYLKNHGLDNKGQMYKVNFFEWYLYDDVMKLSTDSDYNEKAFERYIEIKGSDDHTKLHELLEEVNDYTIPIDEIVEKHFDLDNVFYWMGFQILIGNMDVGARNLYLYSPLNSEKWYFISWDNDSSFARKYKELKNYSDGESWEQGISMFSNLIIFNRMLKVEKYRKGLDDAIQDLRTNYLTEEKVRAKIESYRAVVKPYVYSEPDLEYAKVDEEEYDLVTDAMSKELETNYQYYLESLNKPWPFYVGLPEKRNGKLEFVWDASYDYNNEEITYSFVLATDYEFTNVIASEDGLRLTGTTTDILPPGQYFIRVRARDESGYEQDCYDYYSTDYGKTYGCRSFLVTEDGTIAENLNEE